MEKDKEGLDKLMYLKIERSRLNREHSKMIFDKGVMTYFIFLTVSVTGLVTSYIDLKTFIFMLILAFAVLLFSSIPYLRSMVTERKMLDSMIKNVERMMR